MDDKIMINCPVCNAGITHERVEYLNQSSGDDESEYQFQCPKCNVLFNGGDTKEEIEKWSKVESDFRDTKDDKERLKRGWILSNNEAGEMVIQKYDESDRFKSDDEATEFVVKSYNELLEALEASLYMLNDYEEAFQGEDRMGFDEIEQAINNAKGK